VINVSWADARAYVKWLNRKTSQDYRLLSEAEREYVTRAGTASPYWWGVVATTEQANFSYDINAGGTYKFDGQTDGKFRNQTLPVDDLQPNPWGLHHVHGNVSEWVEDCLHENYKNKPEELKKTGSAWKVGDCFYHVKRGGGYNVTRTYVRSAARLHDEFDSRQSNTSFRVARSVAP
jgi:formylglycine-generating enzyme required for sulfatase activity